MDGGVITMKRLLSSIFGLGLLFALVLPASAVIQPTRVGNAAYTILPTDTQIITTTAFSTARTWTLPAAGTTCIGQTCVPPVNQLVIYDAAGAITSTNTLTIARPSGQTINGNAADLVLSAARVRVVLIPTSPSNWDAYVTGDYRASSVLVGAAVALTTTTAANMTTISLSQGLWSCTANVNRALAAATSVTQLSTSISATTATPGTLGVSAVQFSTAANVMGADTGQVVGPVILAPTATTTYYVVADDTFTVDTNAVYGSITCQRMR